MRSQNGVCMWACTYRGGVLLLLVQPGAAPLLTVAVLLQRVENLIGQLQVHPQPVAHMDLWSKLQGKYTSVTMATAAVVVKGRGQCFAEPFCVCEDAALRCPSAPCSCGHMSPRRVWS